MQDHGNKEVSQPQDQQHGPAPDESHELCESVRRRLGWPAGIW